MAKAKDSKPKLSAATWILLAIFVITSLLIIPIVFAATGAGNSGAIFGATLFCFILSFVNMLGLLPLTFLAPGEGEEPTKIGNVVRYAVAWVILCVLNFLTLFFGSMISQPLTLNSPIDAVIMGLAFGTVSIIVATLCGIGSHVISKQSAKKPTNKSSPRRGGYRNRYGGEARNQVAKPSGYAAVVQELQEKQKKS